MILYALEDADGNLFNLNDSAIDQPARGSFTFLTENFLFDNKIIANSSLPGGILIGKPRLDLASRAFKYTRAHQTAAEFMEAENELLSWLQRTIAIRDVSNNRRLYVAISDINIEYEPGGLKLSADHTISFTALKPFWENITSASVSDTLSIGSNTISFSNDGSLEAYPYIIITTAVAVDDVEIYVDSNKHGIIIQDTTFGTSSFYNMYIDCAEGTILIYNGSIYTDISKSIIGGTGYFAMPVGADDFKVIVSAACSINISWKERNYV